MCHPIWEDVGKYCRYVPYGRHNGTVKLEDHRWESNGSDSFLARVIASGPVRTPRRFWITSWHLELLEGE